MTNYRTAIEEGYRRMNMQKDLIIQKLKEKGCRITKQRLMLLDIILEENCSSCKEIYYQAVKKDAGIGTATVYRMVNMLEEIGAIHRENMYKVSYDTQQKDCAYTVELDDDTVIEFSANRWNQIIESGLSACGYVDGQNVRRVAVKTGC